MQLLPELRNSSGMLESSEGLKRAEFFGDFNIIGPPVLTWNLPLHSSSADFADRLLYVGCTYALFLSLCLGLCY